MSWTQRWIFPQHTRYYCLGSCYAPSSYFLTQRMLSHCSLVHFFVCQTYTVIILEPRLFETEKESFQEIVQLVVIFFVVEFIVFVVVCISLLWRSCLESPIYTTIVIVVKHVFKRNHTCLTQLLNFFLLLFLSCTPNLSWTGEHLLWCIHITETYHCWGWKICA